MEENQLIYFTSLLCSADQSSRFPSYFLARGTKITAASRLQRIQRFLDRPAIFCLSHHKANPRALQSQTDQNLLPQSRFSCMRSASKVPRVEHAPVPKARRQPTGSLRGAADPTLSATLWRMRSLTCFGLERWGENILHILMDLQWSSLPTSKRNPKHAAKANNVASQVSWVHHYPSTILAAPCVILYLPGTLIHHEIHAKRMRAIFWLLGKALLAKGLESICSYFQWLWHFYAQEAAREICSYIQHGTYRYRIFFPLQYNSPPWHPMALEASSFAIQP